MAKKHKCIECGNAMNWEVPHKDSISDKSPNNIKRIKHLCLETIVCGETMKTKKVDHEQYCKKFEEPLLAINMENQKKLWEKRMGDIDG